ncbi:MAG: tetratricopeptide repeat protein [Acidobacteriota bacterium]|jgi:tetratricopeptide (TPR) repeat protein
MLRSPLPVVPAAALLLLATLFLGATVPCHAAHPHYLRLLREGTLALEQGDAAEARHDLRLACFGLLEEPPLLAECLMRLGLAQAELNDTDGFHETFRRMVEIEQRFGAYDDADVPATLRSAFEQALLQRITVRALRTSGVFADLLEPPPETGETGQAGGGPGGASPPADAPEAAPAAPEGSARLGPAERARLDRVRELLESAERRSELEEPFRMAREVAEANPASREAQRLTAVVAYRSSRWQEAVRYFRRGDVEAGDQPQLLFYYAVSLYEAGRPDEAVEPLRRSLPHLERTPFVQSYREKILAEPAPPVP